MEKIESISIIIPTIYNRPNLFSELLSSLQGQKNIDIRFEVVVIDNNQIKNEDLEKKVSDWKRKLVINYFHLEINGLHHARHFGAKVASGDLLIYIDDDIIASDNWLAAYLMAFNKYEMICAGGKVFPRWEVEPEPWITKISNDIFSLLDYGNAIRPLDSKEGINGCNFAIRKSAVFTYGGFHPDGYASPDMKWFRGDGEYGLVQKIKAKGEKIYYLPNAFLYHYIPEKRMKMATIMKLTQDHAVSSAYSFVRSHQCSAVSLLLLYIGSIFYFFLWQFLGIFRSKDNKISTSIQSEKYLTMMKYTMKLVKNKELRAYVLSENYFD